jgi:hypothetical protein
MTAVAASTRPEVSRRHRSLPATFAISSSIASSSQPSSISAVSRSSVCTRASTSAVNTASVMAMKGTW